MSRLYEIDRGVPDRVFPALDRAVLAASRPGDPPRVLVSLDGTEPSLAIASFTCPARAMGYADHLAETRRVRAGAFMLTPTGPRILGVFGPD